MEVTPMEALTTALTTAFSGLADDILGIAVVVVPVGIGIFAAIVAVRYAKKFFNAISK